MTRQDIAKALKVDASTISRDIEYLTIKSQQYIDDMAKKTLPFMYQKSIEGHKRGLKIVLAYLSAKRNRSSAS
jgi:IS30 family transposase